MSVAVGSKWLVLCDKNGVLGEAREPPSDRAPRFEWWRAEVLAVECGHVLLEFLDLDGPLRKWVERGLFTQGPTPMMLVDW